MHKLIVNIIVYLFIYFFLAHVTIAFNVF